MKLILVSFVCIFVAFPAYSGTKVKLLSYKVWKQKKIDEAKSIVEELKQQSRRATNVKLEEDEEEALAAGQKKLAQAELNRALARDLSANDYFILYVIPQFKDNHGALLQAAKTLSTRDVADILDGYERKLQGPDLLGAKSNSSTFETPAL